MTTPEIAVRLTTCDDFEVLLAIKSDPEEVRWSGFAGPPNRENFRKWFNNALADSDRLMFTGLINRSVAGYIHFHRVSPHRFGVSTGVAARLRGKGHGTTIRSLAIERFYVAFPDTEIEVWLAEGNVASQRSWAKMGYHPTEITKCHEFLCPARVETMRRWIRTRSNSSTVTAARAG